MLMQLCGRKRVAGLLVVLGALVSCISITWHEANKAAEETTTGRQSNANSTHGYGVVVDCGSSGSRVYVYRWRAEYVEGRMLTVVEQASNRTNPGLSAFDRKNDSEISSYLRRLLDFAAQQIPASEHSVSPLFLLCTAGMRQLTIASQERILNSVRRMVKANYKFDFNDQHVRIISGKEEAVYMWIAANYLLGRLQTTTNATDSVCFRGACRLRSRGMLEMGGASMQIAFEMDRADAGRMLSESRSAPRDSMVEVRLGCSPDSPLQYFLYATTYLNYGGDAARDRYNLAYFNHSAASVSSSLQADTVVSVDPCLSRGHVKSRTYATADQRAYLGAAPDSTVKNKTVNLTGTGNFEECLKRVKDLLLIRCKPCNASLDNLCNITDQCTMMAQWQPVIPYDSQIFYAFSQFYYRWGELFNQSERYNASVFRERIKRHCESDIQNLTNDYSWYIKARGKYFENQIYQQCFKGTFAYSVLHDAFKFPTSYNRMRMVRKVNGTSPEWALGAMLYKSRYIQARYRRMALSGEAIISGGESISPGKLILALSLILKGIIEFVYEF